MIALVLVTLIVLWFLGYLRIPGLSLSFLEIPLFQLGAETVTLLDILIFLIIVWALELLPSPLRQIGFVVLLLWILATIGVIAISGLPSLLVLSVIVGLILSLLHVV